MIDRLLQNNHAVKILSIFLAFVIWLYIAGDTRTFSEFESSTRHCIKIPVEYHNLSEYLEVVEMTEEVDITVRGQSEDLAQLMPDDLEIYVDLRELREGEHKLAVRGEAPSGIKIEKIFPSEVKVEIDEVITRQMEIKPIISGEPADGMVVDDIQLEPSNVIVKGTSNNLFKVEEVWAVIDVEGETGDITKTVTFKTVDRVGREVTGLELTPEEVEVSVNIDYAKKEVPVEASLKGDLPKGLTIKEVKAQPETVVLSGLKERLKEIEVIETLEIDLKGREKTFTKEIELDIPEGTSLETDTSISVMVLIGSIDE